MERPWPVKQVAVPQKEDFSCFDRGFVLFLVCEMLWATSQKLGVI
jgi:hypothetical protein